MSDPAKDAVLLQKIVEALLHKAVVSYIDVFSSTLLVYDVLLNLDLEIKHVWTKAWSPLTVLYIIQRYLPFMDTAGLVLHHQFGANLSIRYCLLNYNINGWSFIIGIVISELVLALRLWAVWKKSVPVAVGLVVFFLACWAPCFALFAQFLSAMKFAIPPLPNFRGCFIAGGSNILYLCWVLMMIYDSGTLIMILIPGIAAYRMGGSSELVNTVYRDGVIYYAFIFLVSMVNVVMILTLPPDLVHLLSSFERILHSLLTSRAVLHIRRVASRYETIPAESHELTGVDISFSTIPSTSSYCCSQPREACHPQRSAIGPSLP